MLRIRSWFTDRWHPCRKNTNRGSVILISGSMIAVIITLICIAFISLRYLYSVKRVGDIAVVAAGLAALRSESTEDLAYGEYTLSKPAAIAAFKSSLQENLKLDSSLYPLSNHYITTPVTIEEISVYNPEDITSGLTCSCGTAIRRTSIHVVISYRVRIPGLHGLLGKESRLRIHKDVDNHYSLNIA